MPAAATPVARAPAQPATRLTPQIADRAERGRGMIIGGLVALVAALGFGGYLLFSALRGSGGDKSSPSAIGRTDVKEHQASSPLAQALTPKLPDEIVVFGPGKIAIGWGTDPSHLDAPAHDVSVGRFGMSKYETSNAEYKTYFDAVHPSAEPPWVGANFDTISENPVVLITQGEAEKYCEWKYSKWKGRLPSEDEWEYAARDGKSDRRFPWDDGRFDKKKSNAARGEGAPLIPVDSFPEGASPRGLLNLIGNAAEWTASPAALYSGSHAQVRAEGVVVRGGAANTSTTEKLTATARIFVPPETRDPYVGFRCAVTIEPSR